MRERFWEIDVLRGIAVVAMVLYHFSYDLAFVAGLFDAGFFRSGLGLGAGRVIGGSFVFLAGLSLTLSYGRATAGAAGRNLFRKYLLRGLRIFAYGMAITLVTWLLLPNGTIIFGILHLIGASIILAYPFLTLRYQHAVIVGALCIAAGLLLRDLDVQTPYLVWLGTDPTFFMLDYWPIFPWFGVMLLGVAAGHVLYGDRRKRTAPPTPRAARPLASLGRHSLVVYLVHQPVLIAALVLLGVGDARLP